jgi:large subunit ribosomal protein L22
MEARAIGRNLPIAPRKARLVVDLVRNQLVEDALDILAFTHKAAARMIDKLIQSAAANARQNDPNVDESRLYVKKIFVDEGITRKWFRARARGMAYRIRRRRSHITVILDEKKGENESLNQT